MKRTALLLLTILGISLPVYAQVEIVRPSPWIDGSGVAAGPILVTNGSATAPSIAAQLDTDTGRYWFTGGMGDAVDGVGYLGIFADEVHVKSTTSLGWSSGNVAATTDLKLVRDAANALGQRNGTTAQSFRLYTTSSSSNANYERVTLDGSAASTFRLITEASGTGAVRNLTVGTNGGTASLLLRTAGTDRWQIDSSGHWIPVASGSYDIGGSSTTARHIYAGGFVRSGSVAVASLPTCDSNSKGARHFVTDANATTFMSTVAAGGANNVPVVCDGTNWKIG